MVSRSDDWLCKLAKHSPGKHTDARMEYTREMVHAQSTRRNALLPFALLAWRVRLVICVQQCRLFFPWSAFFSPGVGRVVMMMGEE